MRENKLTKNKYKQTVIYICCGRNLKTLDWRVTCGWFTGAVGFGEMFHILNTNKKIATETESWPKEKLIKFIKLFWLPGTVLEVCNAWN